MSQQLHTLLQCTQLTRHCNAVRPVAVHFGTRPTLYPVHQQERTHVPVVCTHTQTAGRLERLAGNTGLQRRALSVD